jgi:hypothetical protein
MVQCSKRTSNQLTPRELPKKLTKLTSTLQSKNVKKGDLNPAGTTYGVKKLVFDPPRWSTDGH